MGGGYDGDGPGAEDDGGGSNTWAAQSPHHATVEPLQQPSFADAAAAATTGSGAMADPPAPCTTVITPQPSLPAAPILLITAGRKVEAIRVRYETVAKKVDVQALKGDFSAALTSAVASGEMGKLTHGVVEAAFREGAGARATQWVDTSGAGGGGVAALGAPAGRATAAANAPPAVSLSSVIKGLAPELSAQVTVPYYFITLLHLANEHGLAIADAPGLGDLLIRTLE